MPAPLIALGLAAAPAAFVAVSAFKRHSERMADYLANKSFVNLGGSWPLEINAYIDGVVSLGYDPQKTQTNLEMHGYKASLYDDAFFKTTNVVQAGADTMLQYALQPSQIQARAFEHDIDVTVFGSQTGLGLIDLHTLANRGNVSQQVISQQLSKLGIRDSGIATAAMSLRHQDIPLQDLIRFAVRDSFTPASVTQYQENQEYPAVLDKFMTWIGVAWDTGINYAAGTDDDDKPTAAGPASWGKIYWASHWVEPSPTQAYEMLFRGYTQSPYGPSPYVAGQGGQPDGDLIFDGDDLKKLLKSADYGPYWRRRLEMIAYHPLNLSDLKRMYRIGILDRAKVYHGLRAQGYDPDNAELMTEYVIRTERPQLAPYVKRSFMLGLIDDQVARNTLLQLGQSEREADLLLQQWRLDRLNTKVDRETQLIRRAYLLGQISADVARGALAQLGIIPDIIAEYLARWDLEVGVSKRIPTLAKIGKWYVDGIIEEDDLIGRLQRLKYTDTDINSIMKELRQRRMKAITDTQRRTEREGERVASQQEQQAKAAERQQREAQTRSERATKESQSRAKAAQAASDKAASKAERSTEQRVKAEQEALDMVLGPIRKASTDKNLKAWYGAGLLTQDEVRRRLSIRGYNDDDIERWIITNLEESDNG